MKFVDFCAGIGGFRIGLESLGLSCEFSCDIDKKCEDTYALNFGTEFDAYDIATVRPSDLPDYDIFCAGFPCQPFSIAGKRNGFHDDRSNVFEHIIRLVSSTQPSVVFLENVKHLIHHDHGNTFRTIHNRLVEQGYFVHHKVLDSKFFGIPQSRERTFIVAFRSSKPYDLFSFPDSDGIERVLSDILIEGDNEHPVSQRWLEYIELYSGRKTLEEIPFDVPKTRVALESNVDGNRLDDYVLQMRSSGIRAIPVSQPFPTFAVSVSGGGAMIPVYVRERRHLSLMEMKRLMGFSDDFRFRVARTHAIKQLANAVCPPVIKEIGKGIIAAIRGATDVVVAESKVPSRLYSQGTLFDHGTTN